MLIEYFIYPIHYVTLINLKFNKCKKNPLQDFLNLIQFSGIQRFKYKKYVAKSTRNRYQSTPIRLSTSSSHHAAIH